MLPYQTTEKTALFYYCSRRTWSMSFILLLFLELLSLELSRKIRRNPPLLPTPSPLTFSPFWSLPLPSMNTTPTFFSPSPLPPHLTILLFHLFIKKKFSITFSLFLPICNDSHTSCHSVPPPFLSSTLKG